MKNVAQNIEIELKNMITQQEFHTLRSFFQLNDKDFFTQENHYFDTVDFALKKAGCALRIRKKNHTYEMTLKQPYGDGLLETNEQIDERSAEQIFKSGSILIEPIRSLLIEMNIDPDLIQYFGSLKTIRAEVEYKEGLIVLDHSYYLNKEDFELEYEVSNRQTGTEVLSALLKTLNIPFRKTENKIMRFYNQKYKQQTKK